MSLNTTIPTAVRILAAVSYSLTKKEIHSPKYKVQGVLAVKIAKNYNDSLLVLLSQYFT